MAHPIQIPRLGWSMEEGTFIEWLKQDGDRIEPGDLLYNLEGEKAIQEIESIDAGFLRIPGNAPAEGETVLVGQVIGWLCAEDEATPELPATTVPAASGAPPATPAAVPAGISSAEPSTRPPVSTPRARRVATELGVDWTTLAGSGRNGRIRERDVRAATNGGSPVASTADTGSESSSSVRHTIANRMLIAS
ncbi:MAG: E3 binding domain-containing protein, partial [Planctomycetaceae bacterium]